MRVSDSCYKTVKIVIFVCTDINPFAAETLEKEGCHVERLDSSISEEELKKRIENVDILGIRSKTKVTRAVIEKAKRLKAICCFCIGTDQVDLRCSTEYGIVVFHSPTANSISVVELVLSELIALSRNLIYYNSSTHSGKWTKSASGSFQIRGKTLGIIGMGNIGKKVASAVMPLGVNVQYYDIVDVVAPPNAVYKPLNELLATSDFITLHVPGTSSVIQLIGDKELSLMKKGSYILNASRGYVIDIDALVKHLKSGHLAGAAIDVYPEEPGSNKEPFTTKLANIPNVILTPHIGGSTVEAQKAVASEVLESIHDYFYVGSITRSANFDNTEFPPLSKGCVRFVNCHQNSIGVLKEISTKLDSFNISNLHSCAIGPTSYSVIDVEVPDKSINQFNLAVEKIKAIPSVIWTRNIYS